jgi:hypothetical protein
VLAVIFDCYGKIRSGITEKDAKGSRWKSFSFVAGTLSTITEHNYGWLVVWNHGNVIITDSYFSGYGSTTGNWSTFQAQSSQPINLPARQATLAFIHEKTDIKQF